MRRHNSVFIAATGQNVGKTTVCLGILAGLLKRYHSVGFIKPVGQQHVTVDGNVKVDKDVVLFKERFKLPSAWRDMSPVIVPGGFTRDYLDGKVTEDSLHKQIIDAFERIYTSNDYTVVEGTGHVGVGSIIDMNNAKVAAELGLDMVLIGSGGLGSTIDELSLNLSMCRDYGVRMRGVILNRVYDDKREMVVEYISKALKKYGIPLIGCIPYNEFLSNPTMRDFENLFDTSLISGEKHHYRHFKNIRLVAGSLHYYVNDMIPNELIITPASREDIVRATLKKHRESAETGVDFGGGLILTGRHRPSEAFLREIRQVDIPVIYAPMCSYDAMKRITHHTAKIRIEDVPKVEQAIRLVEDNIDFEKLTAAFQNDPKK